LAEIVRAEFEERLAKASAGSKRADRESRDRRFTISRAIRPDINGNLVRFGERGDRSRWKATMDRPVSVSPDEDGSSDPSNRGRNRMPVRAPVDEPPEPSGTGGDTSGAKRPLEGSPEDGTTRR
tara:strand:+ start:1165 stop:1536 length:372 start_codon:yes stop_codon:yes gene_type:complete